MPDISDAHVQITLTISELRDLVALANMAAEQFGNEGDIPPIVGEVSGLYFELMENIKVYGTLGVFQPE